MSDYCDSYNTYALANKCFPLFSPKKVVMKNWLKGKKIYTGDTPLGQRYFTPLILQTGFRFMDIITGSMYSPNGYCLSSNYLKVNNLKVVSTEKEKLLNEILKSKRGLGG